MSCQQSCEPGYFLDLEKKEPECKVCPPNTFSLGGGSIYDDWKKVLGLFGSKCSYFENGKWIDNKNCEAFKVNPDGKSISAGRSYILNDTVYYFELSFGIHTRKRGNVIFYHITLDYIFLQKGFTQRKK